MITRRNATLFLTATCAAILWGLAGCNKTPSHGGATPQAGATAATPSSPGNAVAAELQEPPLVAPSRRDPEAIAMQQKYIQWVKDKAMPAGMQRPALPDPNRTDEAAVMQRYKFGLWEAAGTLAATDAALKQQEQFYGPAPKGNYGQMAQGLKPLPAEKK